jgi:hypothetical protein
MMGKPFGPGGNLLATCSFFFLFLFSLVISFKSQRHVRNPTIPTSGATIHANEQLLCVVDSDAWMKR